MESEPNDTNISGKTEDLTIEFKKILEKGIKYLKKIENLIDNRTDTLINANKSLDKMDSTLREQFLKTQQNILAPLELEISKTLGAIKPKIKKLSNAQIMIKDVINQLEMDLPQINIRDVLPKLNDLENIDFTQPIIPQIKKLPTTPISGEFKKESPISSKLKSVQPTKIETHIEEVSSDEIAPEEDISSSEGEGIKIFSEIIVGWKLRDWVATGGTKDIFVSAWKKLSTYDKQKIRTGTWSKPIMEKVKLLGREKPSSD